LDIHTFSVVIAGVVCCGTRMRPKQVDARKGVLVANIIVHSAGITCVQKKTIVVNIADITIHDA
jgi:hypothetical protein